MKKYNFFTIIILIIISCDNLDIEPTSDQISTEVLTSRTGIKNAVVGCYDALQSDSYYGRNFVLLGALLSDNGYASGTIKEYLEMDNNSVLATNTVIDGIWSSVYASINGVNEVIAALNNNNIDMAESEKEDYLGQMRFIRALNYFDLIRLFGDLPLRLTPTQLVDEVHQPRSPKDTIISYVIQDLVKAVPQISNTETTKPTANAAMALLSKVYLYNNQYEESILYANNVISELEPLDTSFASLFDGTGSNDIIYQINFNEQDRTVISQYFLPNSFEEEVYGGRKEVAPTSELILLYELDDKRKKETIKGSANAPFVYKYRDYSTGADNVIVLRLADIYLTKAEAMLKSGENLTDVRDVINIVRERAGLRPLTAVSSLTYERMKEEILLQSRLEFAFEGHRWFDLVRWEEAMNEIETVNNSNQYLMPVPTSEIQANKLINNENQNPGY